MILLKILRMKENDWNKKKKIMRAGWRIDIGGG